MRKKRNRYNNEKQNFCDYRRIIKAINVKRTIKKRL